MTITESKMGTASEGSEVCLGQETRFTLFLDAQVSFDMANEICNQVEGRSLARISTEEENELLLRLMNSAEIDFTWIGLHAVASSSERQTELEARASSALDPRRFVYVDGSDTGPAFYETEAIYPWRGDNPDVPVEQEACVAIKTLRTTTGWVDTLCSRSGGFVCRSSTTNCSTTADLNQSGSLDSTTVPSIAAISAVPTLAPVAATSSDGDLNKAFFAIPATIFALSLVVLIVESYRVYRDWKDLSYLREVGQMPSLRDSVESMFRLRFSSLRSGSLDIDAARASRDSELARPEMFLSTRTAVQSSTFEVSL